MIVVVETNSKIFFQAIKLKCKEISSSITVIRLTQFKELNKPIEREDKLLAILYNPSKDLINSFRFQRLQALSTRVVLVTSKYCEQEDKYIDDIDLNLYKESEFGLESLEKEVFDIFKGTQNEIQNSRLTFREKEILELLLLGLSNKQISQKLYLSEKTIKNHLTLIYKKLGVKSRIKALIVYRDLF